MCSLSELYPPRPISEDAALHPSAMEETLLSVVPPFRYATVEEGIYRGAYPTLRNFPFLRGLQLRTIISLTPEEPIHDLRAFAASCGIWLCHIPVERYKGEVQLLPTDMSEVLQLLINVERHPVYIHCLDGRHVVGLAIMGLRKLQRWDVRCSHLEYQRFTQSVGDEVAFIADYSGPLAVPRAIPRWLWDGTWCEASGKPKRLHLGVRLKFPVVTPPARSSAPPAEFPPPRRERSTSAEADDAARTPRDPPAVSAEAYVDVRAVSPAVPIGPIAAVGAQPAAFALRIDRRAADVRLFSLRVSGGAVGGAGGGTPLREASWDAEEESAGSAAQRAAIGATRSVDGNVSSSSSRYSTRSHLPLRFVHTELVGTPAVELNGGARKVKRRKSL